MNVLPAERRAVLEDCLRRGLGTREVMRRTGARWKTVARYRTRLGLPAKGHGYRPQAEFYPGYRVDQHVSTAVVAQPTPHDLWPELSSDETVIAGVGPRPLDPPPHLVDSWPELWIDEAMLAGVGPRPLPLPPPGDPPTPAVIRIPLNSTMRDAEREIILRTLEANAGNKTKTAEVLGISRRSVYNKLAEYAGLKEEVPPALPAAPSRLPGRGAPRLQPAPSRQRGHFLEDDLAQEKILAELEGRPFDKQDFYRRHQPYQERSRIPEWRL